MNLDQNKSVRVARCCRGLLMCFGLLFVLGSMPQPASAQTPTVVSFTNSAAITKATDDYGQAALFPSVITVPNFGGTLQKVTVTLSGVSADDPSSFDIEVAGPSGAGGGGFDV